MKQYKSIQITERDMLRLIDKLYCYQKICKGYMPMDDEFFEYMSFMPREKVIQAINSMYDKELIKKIAIIIGVLFVVIIACVALMYVL